MKKLFIALFIMALLISPAHADLTSETSKTIFLCDASETEFDFDFKVFDEDDIEVILVLESTGAETTLTLTTEYTVSDISSTGGTVTTVSTYSALYTLIVRRDQALKQEIDYVPQGPFSTKVLEQGLDTMVMMIQNNKEKIDRSLLQVGTATESITFPAASASKVIGWNAAGTGLENVTAPTTITVADTADTTTYVSLWESATGDLYPKSDGGITYNAGTANLSATTFTGALTGNVTGNADTATVGTTVTITDNESTAENNPIVFVAGGDLDGGNLGLESDGTCYYTPSTGIITTTGFAGALTGNASTVTTNANSTGDVTSVGNATDITESVLEEGGTDELTITSGMVNSGTNASDTSYFRGDNTWVVPAGGGDLLADGTVPLTASWDVGAFTLTGLTFVSDQATGTAPLTVASTTKVTNLNADAVDGVSVSGETATGMIFVNDASDIIDGLGAQGNSGQVLTSAGAGANPTWGASSEVYIGYLTRDQAAASGDVATTGVGFVPKGITFTVSHPTQYTQSEGSSDGTRNMCRYLASIANQDWDYDQSFCIFLANDGNVGHAQKAVVKTFDADGFTLTWTKVDTPTAGTLDINYVAWR